MTLRRLATAVVPLVVLVATLSAAGPAGATRPRPEARAMGGLPLAGEIVVLDPGHQLGNHNFPQRIRRQVPAGGFRKPCNTTGTATDRGYAEATFVWEVSRIVKRQLEALGAHVVLTRHDNSQLKWGPCVDVRGRAGNLLGADLKLSIHADGSRAAGARGFHVIAPADRRGWTDDIFGASRLLAVDLRAALRARGFARANYVAGGDGLDVRGDLATLNLSDVPVAMVELGNMRNAREARRMASPAGRAAYAAALVAGVHRYLGG